MYRRSVYTWIAVMVLVSLTGGVAFPAAAAPALSPPSPQGGGGGLPILALNDPAPPPLPRSCITGGTPLDYDQPLCCVSGYVYLDGAPVENAEVTITIDGRSLTVQTASGPGSDQPYFAASLDSEPLNAQPGDLITLQAAAGGQSKTLTFTAQEGGQQVDIVLPQNTIEAVWYPGYLLGRGQHALAQDPLSQNVLLFGGRSTESNVLLSDMWVLSDTTWIEIVPSSSPPPRAEHALAYDSNRRRVVLFGGCADAGETGCRSGGAVLADTWEWDGNRWLQRRVETSPPGRDSHAMAYDAAHGQVLLFGGRGESGDFLGDTWLWDGEGWTQAAPATSPPARGAAAMVYDAAHGRLLLFGGENETGLLNDTWEWDGSSWTRRWPTASPAARAAHALAYDPGSERVVLLGGYNQDDTWLWDGATWSQQSPQQAPSKRWDHALMYDPHRQQVVAFGGWDDAALTFLGDTWAWDGANWAEIASSPSAPAPRSQAALSYESHGQSIIFGGRSNGQCDNQTYRWDGSRLTLLTPSFAPPCRAGHRLARNGDGSALLAFGGLGTNNQYLDDTLVWTGSDWESRYPLTRPEARAYYGLTYDTERDVWLLFGGIGPGGYLSDTWEYNGILWSARQPAHSPPARSHATLTFDPARGRAVLIGGQNTAGLLDDVWEWDGSDWQEVTPGQTPGARAGHGAAYDAARQVIVIAGGVNATGILSDAWEWNGAFWRQRVTDIGLPAMYNLSLTYDPLHDRVIAFGGENDRGAVGGLYLHQVIGTPSDAPPVATINRIQPLDARQGVDVITFEGSGQDADSSDAITAYRWTHDGNVISSQAVFTATADTFPLGAQTIRFQVQDDEGTWSPIVEKQIYIRDGSGGTGGDGTWTLLLYAVADNNLDPWMGDNPNLNGMLYRLQTAGAQAGVRVGILYDGPDVGDTRRYILEEDGGWTEEAVGEARMDEMETLRDFIAWGYDTFDSDYYALALINHANGVVGFGQDLTSDGSGRAFLTPIELRSALQAATDDGARKIDVLHYDGCSFGLFEDAAIAAGQADFVIASPNTGWGIFAYDIYRQQAAGAENPRAYAEAVAQTYATALEANGLPYTISVFDMARFDDLNAAVGALGDALLTYVNGDPPTRIAELETIRTAAQKYDSGGTTPIEPDDEDSYVDLVDLAVNLRSALSAADVLAAAAALSETVRGAQPFLVEEYHASADFDYYDPYQGQVRTLHVNLDQAHGLGIFYPPRSTVDPDTAYMRYIQNELFDVTRDSGWTRFLAQGLPPQMGGSPPPLEGDTLLQPLLYGEQASYRVFLPVVVRR